MASKSAVWRSVLLRGASMAALVAPAGLAGPAMAQTAPAGAAIAASAVAALPEVVVTAERRTNTVQKSPIAISAVTAQTLDKSFVNEISSLNAVVPSLEITKTSGAENLVTIRGVGSETPENSLTTSPGVSEFIDGVYVANTISLDQTLFDVGHIEVLRGPQGDLYGQSSIGGAINIVTKQPQLHSFSGSGDLSAGNYNLFRERLELNVPVGDTFAIRGSVQKFDHDGFTKDTYFANFREDDAHNTGGKLAALWKPADTFTATLTGQWYRATENGPAQKNIIETLPYSRVLALNPAAPAASPFSSDPWTIYQDYKGKFDLTTQLYHLNLDWELPFAEITSVTAYQHLYHVSNEDSSRSAFNILGSYDDVAGWTDQMTNYSEEFDVLSRPGGPVDWIVGAFMVNQDAHTRIAEFEGTGNPNTNPGLLNIAPDISTHPPANLSYGNATNDTRQGGAGFARVTWHVTPRFRLSAGGRYNWDRYSNSSHNYSGFGFSTASYVSTTSTPTWRFEADYDLTPVNLIYGSVARGYKPGGANGNANQAVVKNLFLPETNDAYEIGSKNQFFDRTLQLNVALFYYDHRNFQYIEQDPVPFDSGMANIPHIRDYGAEFEGHYAGLSNKLHIDGTLALEKGEVIGKYLTIDSTVADKLEGPSYSGNNSLPFFGPCAFSGAYYNPACWAAVTAQAKDIQGKEPPAMPNVSGSIAASYDFDVGMGKLTPWVQYVYRGEMWARIFNEPSLDRVPAYGVTNLNISFVPARYPAVKLSLAGTNLFNTKGINSQYTDPYGTAQTSRQYIAPRQVIGAIAFTF